MAPPTHLTNLHVGTLPGTDTTLLVRTYADGELTLELLTPDGRGTGEHTLAAEPVQVAS